MMFYTCSNQVAWKTLVSIIFSLFFLSGCDLLNQSNNENENEDELITSSPSAIEAAQLTLAVAPKIAWMPWFLADEEGVLKEQAKIFNANIQFISDTYQEIINQFIDGEIDAMVINNIDAIAQLVRQDVEADVILITNYSHGNQALLLSAEKDSNTRHIRGKTFALMENSTQHYLLDRFLIRNQIDFSEINIRYTAESDIITAFQDREIYGVVTTNPNIARLINEADAKVLFDSREIPEEIFDLLIIRRETLIDYPQFAQILLNTWFSIMQRLQGNKKGPTLDAMARLANLTREEYDSQITTTPFTDTATKALSSIRAHRRMRKIMRHIRYFIERHDLVGEEIFTGWVSYPGRTAALLHFNGQPLQTFVIPKK